MREFGLILFAAQLSSHGSECTNKITKTDFYHTIQKKTSGDNVICQFFLKLSFYVSVKYPRRGVTERVVAYVRLFILTTIK